MARKCCDKLLMYAHMTIIMTLYCIGQYNIVIYLYRKLRKLTINL